MWFWLHKNIVKQYRIALYTASASLVVHIVFFGVFFFFIADRNAHVSFSLTPRNNAVQYTVMPMRSSRTHTGIKTDAGKKTSSSQSSSLSSLPRKKATPVKKPQTVIQQPQKKVVKKTVKPAPKKGDVKKSDAKKKSQKAVAKKVEPKKAAPVKAEPKKVEPEKVEPPKEPEPVADPVKPLEAENTPMSDHEEIIAQQEHRFNLNDIGLYEEYEMLQEKIVTHWAPPPGVKLDALCQISFFVDWQGVVNNLTIDQSSGVLMYDISARRTLESLAMPRWTWGKTLTITFNQ